MTHPSRRVFSTSGFSGYAVEFSPFNERLLAVATGANFGIIGNGRLFVLGLPPSPNGDLECHRVYETQDGLFDLSFSECHDQQLVTAAGDGSIRLWDLSLKDHPVKHYREHTREVMSVNWGLVRKETFLSSSWDGTIKLWDPTAPKSLSTWTGHGACVYQAIGSPRALDVFASAGGDALVKTWDTRSPQSTASFQAHQGEVLSLDWNKYEPQTIVSGGTDKMVKVWDLRALAKPVSVLAGHEFAVRRVKTSPHSPFILASASYDMTVRFWDSRTGAQVFVHNMHTEFSVGVDFSLFQPGRIATCGWDAIVDVMDVPQILPV